MKNKRIITIAFGLCIALCITFIAIFQFWEVQERRVEERAVAKEVVERIGPSLLAEAYKMSQTDYNRLMGLKNQLLKTRKISDSDLSWLLALLNPSTDYVVHMRVLGMLQLLGNSPPSQKEQIKSALLPYVEKDDPRFRNSLKRIHKFVFGKPNWQPGDPPF